MLVPLLFLVGAFIDISATRKSLSGYKNVFAVRSVDSTEFRIECIDTYRDVVCYSAGSSDNIDVLAGMGNHSSFAQMSLV